MTGKDVWGVKRWKQGKKFTRKLNEYERKRATINIEIHISCSSSLADSIPDPIPEDHGVGIFMYEVPKAKGNTVRLRFVRGVVPLTETPFAEARWWGRPVDWRPEEPDKTDQSIRAGIRSMMQDFVEFSIAEFGSPETYMLFLVGLNDATDMSVKGDRKALGLAG